MVASSFPAPRPWGCAAVHRQSTAPSRILWDSFGVELPKTNPQNSAAGWVALQRGSPSSRQLSVPGAAVMDLGAA